MERLTSLINKLEQQIKQGADSYELLATTGHLKMELHLTSPGHSVMHQNSVSVWLPSGYKMAAPAALSVPETVAVVQVPSEIQAVPVPVKDAVVNPDILVPSVPKAPAPPKVIEEVKHEPVPLSVLEGVLSGGPLFYQLQLEEEVKEDAPPEPVKMEVPKPVQKPFPQYPDAAELIKSVFQAPPASKDIKKEVNELVFETAMPLNQRLHEKKVELAEVLAAGPKISDLRKAISINEKYQMINSLFRGDDNMFERSVRTLNNFGSLPEARFWMQRELALKLGWNEEEELVQHFYKLVSRRFS